MVREIADALKHHAIPTVGQQPNRALAAIVKSAAAHYKEWAHQSSGCGSGTAPARAPVSGTPPAQEAQLQRAAILSEVHEVAHAAEPARRGEVPAAFQAEKAPENQAAPEVAGAGASAGEAGAIRSTEELAPKAA